MERAAATLPRALLELDAALRPAETLYRLMCEKALIVDPRGFFVATAIQQYHVMKASVSLLRHVAAEASIRPDLEHLMCWASQHAVEEAPHYEWLLEDLCSIGINPAVVRDAAVSFDVAGLVGNQFFLVSTLQPTVALGYFYVMECRPRTKKTLLEFASSNDIPESAIRTFLMHVEIDQHHKQEINDLICRYYAHHKAAIERGASICLEGWTRYFAGYATGAIKQSLAEREDRHRGHE